MAIFSLELKIISRGKGKSAVEAAAYRAAAQITNEYDGQTHDYTPKKGLVYDTILLPENAPTAYRNRATLWNAVEQSERAKNAQLAREVRLALPNELSLAQNVSLTQQYVQENFVNNGMCADICIHDKKDGNIHAHVMLTMRPLERDGTWGAKAKMIYVLDENGERIKLPSGRPKTTRVNVTNWDDRGNADIWREAWATKMNMYLEYFGHEARVDHRSYEKQGKEQIPTIHLGAMAHGLEKRGIATERGNINRAIKKANERLQSINNQIHELENPPIPQMLIDLQNSVKAQDSPGYANWAKIFNLKQAAETLLYIQNGGFEDLDSLQSAQQEAETELADIVARLSQKQAELKSLSTQKAQTENYRNTLDVYKKHIAPGQFKYFKDKYYETHKAEIEKHKKAKAYLFNELKLEKLPSLKRLSTEISTLRTEEMELKKSKNSAQEKANALTNAANNVRLLLGFKELELQGYMPTTPTKNLRHIKPYSKPLSALSNNDTLKRHFQSCHIDYDCVYDIYKAIFSGKSHQTTAEEILTKYSKERAEAVVTAIVNNAPANTYPEHKEWATRKENSPKREPSARNLEIFQRHNDKHKILGAFIQKFRDVADTMRFMNFPFEDGRLFHVDEHGRQITRPGWVLPREFVTQKAGEENWDVGLSFADRFAVAELKADEHNRNRQIHAPQKLHKSSDMEW